MDNLSGIRRQLFLAIYLLVISAAQASDFVFTPINASQGLSDNQIRSILQLPDGRMVFTTSGNVNIYDGAHFAYLHRSAEDIYPLNKYEGHYHIYLSGDSLLWIKDRHKLMCVDLYQQKYIPNLDAYFRQKGVEEPVEDLFVDTEQRIWLLTPRGLLEPGSLRLLDLPRNKGKIQDLAVWGKNVYLFYDTGEVACYDIKSRKYVYSSAAYPETEQPNFQSTSLVVKGSDGFYQLRNGSKGGFFFFDPQNRTWKKLLEKEHWFNTLILTPQNTAYVSSPDGIWIIHPKNGEQHYMPVLKTMNGNLIKTEISTLFYDKQGALWVGTINRGLMYYHPSRYKFTYVGCSSFPESSSKDLAVQAFAEDEAGNIYLKSHSVIYQYHPLHTETNVLTPVPLSSLPEKVRNTFNKGMETPEFQGKPYTALCTDIRGWTWAGTSDGLELFIPGTQTPRSFYSEDGLSNNFVHAILEDKFHRIWVTTSHGISQIQVDSISKKVHFTNFNSYDGTLEGEYMEGAVFESTNGTLYFGGIDGFNVLRPGNLSASHLPFKPIFISLRLQGEEVKPGNRYDDRLILSKAAPYTKDIELSYNQNFLTVEYSAPNYQNQTQTCYRYQLEGIDADWRETAINGGEDNRVTDGLLRASYTNLPPGKYTFKVMAGNNDRKWNGGVTTLNITIHAPWWKTITAYCLYAMCFLIISAGSVYLYIYTTRKELKRQHKEEILLLRIRNLIDQAKQQEEKPKPIPAGPVYDTSFLTKAMELVEKNLNVPGYSVEQLSRDLCMDRTGLYRKLTTMLDQSPSLFIRNIRLQRAAQLILQGELSVAEITERVGFSSSSYLSKCFQEEFGCRPSEYVAKMKKIEKA